MARGEGNDGQPRRSDGSRQGAFFKISGEVIKDWERDGGCKSWGYWRTVVVYLSELTNVSF